MGLTKRKPRHYPAAFLRWARPRAAVIVLPFGLVLAGLVLLAPAATAQSGGDFSIVRNTLDGGGGRSTGGDFVLTGTIAQPDADPAAATGSDFRVRGGFHLARTASVVVDPIFSDGFESP